MCDDNKLDQLLDAALSTYAEPGPNSGPNSGLEERVLAHLAVARATTEASPIPVPLLRPGKGATNRRRWLPWAIALPAAACLLLIFFMQKTAPLRSSRAEQGFTQPPYAAMRAENSLAPKSASAHHKPLRQTVARMTQPAPLPKLDVFPTPRPLTAEEQALAVFISHASDSERKALIESQKQFQAPISIAAIRIPPLEPLKPLDQDTPDPNNN
jgi:hypothetical protein